jgi:RNA 2',3'-cyclic 3'-phosphodiesterase
LRAFISLEVEEEAVVDGLISVQREFVATGADIKPVEKENLHFTLKFLGEITDQQVAEVDRRMSGLALEGMRFGVRGVGAFPNARSPRVVWVGVDEAHRTSLAEMGKRVISSLGGIGEEDRRPFEPHLTIGRVRSARNVGSLSRFIEVNSAREFGESEARHIKLKSSRLTPQGPIYSDVRVYVLGVKVTGE